MANVYGSNVWTLDTAGAIWSYTAQGPIKIRKLLWKPSAASESLAVDETDVGEIWTATSSAAAPAGEQELDFNEGKWFDGLTLTTITAGGKLYVYPA
ncbi:MAG: hypothetical protein WC390_08635 [Sulfurimonas sp.]|jgi:hypothetical protein